MSNYVQMDEKTTKNAKLNESHTIHYQDIMGKLSIWCESVTVRFSTIILFSTVLWR